jgi:hypothetical protein
MAYLIFDKDKFTEIHRIAENETILNENKSFHNEHMSLVQINDTDFLNFKKGLVEFVSCDGTNVVWNSITPDPIIDVDNLNKHINYYLNHTDKWLVDKRNVNKPMWSSVKDFDTYLRSLDSTSIMAEGNPLNITLVEYVMNQGQTAYNVFELL